MLVFLSVYIGIKHIAMCVTELCKRVTSVVHKGVLQTHINIFHSKVLTMPYISMKKLWKVDLGP